MMEKIEKLYFAAACAERACGLRARLSEVFAYHKKGERGKNMLGESRAKVIDQQFRRVFTVCFQEKEEGGRN